MFEHNAEILEVIRFNRIGPNALIKMDPEKWNKSDQARINKFVSEVTFSRAIDNIQTFISETLSDIFKMNPKLVPHGKIEQSLLFESNNLDEIRDYIVEKSVVSFSYKNLVDVDKEMRSRYAFSLFERKLTQLRLQRLIEMRNLLVHNRGIINRIFLNKVGFKYERVGTNLKIPSALSTYIYLENLAADIDRRVIEKFGI